ncbi:MAG: alpha/beta hydrolase-fold protein [Candidatus Zixiibacteriota bacterium]
MRNLVYAILTIVVLYSYLHSQENNDSALVIGEYISVQSEILNETRTLSVYVPSGYSDSKEKYPVLYVLDGGITPRMMLAAATTEALNSLGLLPEMIIIGIDSKNSVRDYFPQPLDSRPGSGHADDFIDFIDKELIPFVDSRYRTNSYRVLCGASNSGMLTVYTMLTKPELFSSYIAASPSVGWFPDFITQLAAQRLDGNAFPSKSIYMNYGTDDLERIVLNAIDTFTTVFTNHAPENLRWTMERIPDGGHVPYISFYDGLRFVIPDWKCPDSIITAGGLAGVQAYYEELSQRYGFPIRVPTQYFSDIGMNFLRATDYTSAIDIFTAFTTEYPNSVRANYYLGTAYLGAGDTTQAVTALQRAIEADSTFAPAKNKLQQIQN